MIAEVIAIGDELTTGQRLDTNSRWLAERLTEQGCEVLYHTTVADDLAANVAVFENASQRADVVVTTGGLGPTQDDLTREVLAKLLGTELVLDEVSLLHIEGMFRSRGRSMPERNKLQAMFPEGSEPIPNAGGTAPGVFAQIQREGRTPCALFALPGVPAEMKPMFDDAVLPHVLGTGPTRVIRHRRIKCFGIGESHLEAKLPELIRRGREPRVGITASGATITLRITAAGVDEAACWAAMEPTAQLIHKELGHLIFGEEEQELQHVLLDSLVSRELSLATAESASQGVVARWLHEADTALSQFAGGVVLPTDRTKDAIAMASTVREQFAVDVGLAIGRVTHEGDTGRAATPAIPIAIATASGSAVQWFSSVGHPSIQAERNAKIALNTLRLALLRDELP